MSRVHRSAFFSFAKTKQQMRIHDVGNWLADWLFSFAIYRSRPFTLSSVSVVVSLSPLSRPLRPSTTARRTSAASATYVFPSLPHDSNHFEAPDLDDDTISILGLDY